MNARHRRSGVLLALGLAALVMVGQTAGAADLMGVGPGSPAAGSDDFDTATTVSSLPYSTTMDTTSATTALDDPDIPCGETLLWPQGYNTVWWQYTPAADGAIAVDTFGAYFDTLLAVWKGTRGSLVNVACNEDAAGSQESYLAARVDAGVTYYIEVAGYSSNDYGELTLHVKWFDTPIEFGRCRVAGTSSDYITQVAVGDLDKDGWVDVVTGDDAYQILAWQNPQAPFRSDWSATTIGTREHYIGTVAVGDLDKDTWPDVVSGDYDYDLIAWKNDATPFGDSWSPTIVGNLGEWVLSVAIGDLDKDTWPDIVSGDEEPEVRVWQNDTTPFAGAWISNTAGTRSDYVTSVAVGDLDKDTWPDVVSGDIYYDVVAYQNDGTPFTEEWASNEVGTTYEDVSSVALGDLDQDTWLDIVTGDYYYNLQAWENDETPFADGWSYQLLGTPSGYIYSAVIGDLNQDGYPDVVSGDEDYYIMAYQNPQSPFDTLWYPFEVYKGLDYVRGVATADLDNDTDLDIVAVNEDYEVVVCENRLYWTPQEVYLPLVVR